MGIKTEKGNYSETFVSCKHWRAQCLYGRGGERLLRDTQSMKIRFLLWITLSELLKTERNWRDCPYGLKTVFANTSYHVFIFLKTHENYFPYFCFRIQHSAKCSCSDGCTDLVFNHFNMYKVILFWLLLCVVYVNAYSIFLVNKR